MFTAYDYDGVSKLSGLSEDNGELSFSFYKNGTEIADQTYTVTEVGSTGTYTLNTTFATTGYWSIFISIIDADTTDIISELRTDVEVTSYNIDDVYTEVGDSSGSGIGNETCAITVEDTNNDDALVAQVAINVFNEDKTVFVTYGYTDTDGEITFYLDAGTYKLVPYKIGYSVSDTTITVADNGGIGTQTYTVNVESVNVVAPTQAGVCRLYADFKDQGGSPIANFKVSVTTIYDASSLSLSVTESRKIYTANASGHVQFDIVQGLKIEVSLVGTEVTSVITVPSSSVANLMDLLDTADSPTGGLAIITI